MASRSVPLRHREVSMARRTKQEGDRGNERKWADSMVSAETMRKLAAKIENGELKVDLVEGPEAEDGKTE